jgi:prolyl oligopeptidase
MPLTKRTFPYPSARRGEVVDDFHGTAIPDPYRWLEDPDADATKAFVAAQNALTAEFVSELPARAQFAERLTALWNYPRRQPPHVRGRRRFYRHNDGLQNQAVLYRQEGVGEPEVLLDPNQLSADGTTALISESYSDDGRHLAYSLSQSGSDWQEIAIRDTDSGEDLPERLRWCKFSQPVWLRDGSGFYYARYPAPAEMPAAAPSTHQRVYFHQLGTDQTADLLIYARPDIPELGFDMALSGDGRYLILTGWEDTDPTNRVFVNDSESDEGFVALIPEREHRYEFLTNDGSLFYFWTDFGAENGRVIAIDLEHPAPEAWQEVVPEADEVIETVQVVHDELIVNRLQHAAHRLYRYALDGTPRGEIVLPALGSVAELRGRRKDNALYFLFQSFLTPPTLYRFDFAGERLLVEHAPQVPFDADGFETRQVFIPSKDGTRVPLFITCRKDLPLTGDNPTLLYGYGGFNISLPPLFSGSRLAWLAQGGIFAQANLRGGMEYGEAWHQAGRLEKKQNVFDDFIAAGEWLISNGYANSNTLAIEGRSNGGLLVAACITQRPDLFGAAHCGVPVIDMLRYQRFTAGRYWVGEYGVGSDPAQFPFLIAYSPLHNVRNGERYPPLLITTAESDDRVVPMHAYKFAAALQHADAGANPLLLRVETRAGHGLGKPISKLIAEAADVYGFLWTYLTVGA